MLLLGLLLLWFNGIALQGKPISELRRVTCHMGSHSVTCHPTQVNAPRHNPSRTDRYSTYLQYLGGMEDWVDLGVGYISTEMVYLSADSHPSG